eukprot:6492489-Amphidinium_carterae.1
MSAPDDSTNEMANDSTSFWQDNPWRAFAASYATASEDNQDVVGAVTAVPLFELNTSDVQVGKKRKGRPRACVKELEAALGLPNIQSASSGMQQSSSSQGLTGTSVLDRVAPMARDVRDVGVYEAPDPTATHMYAPNLPVSALVSSSIAHATAEEALLDKGTLAIASRFLETPDFHLGSKVLLQELTGVDRKGIAPRLHRLAACVLLMMRLDRAKLEKWAVSNTCLGGCIAYLDLCSYDETPMLSRVKCQQHLAGADVNELSPMDAHSMDALQKLLSGVQVSGPTKLLQLQSQFGMLLKVLESPILLCGPTLDPIFPMSKNNGQVILQCLATTSGVTTCADRFRVQLRGTVLDKGPANGVAER